MFDVGASELLLIAVVAIIVIGPKDMPLALRTAGRWVAKIRSISNHFRAGIETMIREAELEEMEKKWQEQNRKVMEQHPEADSEPPALAPPASAEARSEPPPVPETAVPETPAAEPAESEAGGPPPPP